MPDPDKRFHLNREETKEGYHPDYDMFHPKSKVSFLILWLYSLEPPLYFFFNKACRDRDYKLLPLLGPFATALGRILDGPAEKGRPDTMQQGVDILNLGN